MKISKKHAGVGLAAMTVALGALVAGSALHGAAHKNFVAGIELLVQHGGDLAVRSHRVSQFESRGNKGNTALDWATGVQIGMQSSIYHPEAVAMVTKLMNERGIPIEGLSNTKGGRVNQKQ